MSLQTNNVWGSIQRLQGGGTGYTRFSAVKDDEIQIAGTLNVVTEGSKEADIELDGTSIQVPTQVVVRDVGDFPAPVAGVISLEADTNYYIQGDVDIGVNVLDFFGDRISIRGVEKRITFLRCNNATNMFTTTTDLQVSINDITLSQEGTGDVIEIISSFSGRMTFDNVNFNGGAVVGSVGGVLEISNSAFLAGATYIHRNVGLSILNFTTTSFSDVGAPLGTVLLDFETGTFTSTISIMNCFLVSRDGTAMRAVTPDLLRNAVIQGTTFFGAGTLFDGMSEASNTWTMTDNIDIPESHVGGSFEKTGGSITIVIGTVNVWQDVTGVGMNYATSEPTQKISLVNALTGEFEYTGGKTRDYLFGGYVSIKRVGGTTRDIQIGVCVNGVIVGSSVITTGLDSNRESSLVIPLSSKVLEQGDLVKMQIRNITDANDVTIDYGNISLH